MIPWWKQLTWSKSSGSGHWISNCLLQNQIYLKQSHLQRTMVNTWMQSCFTGLWQQLHKGKESASQQAINIYLITLAQVQVIHFSQGESEKSDPAVGIWLHAVVAFRILPSVIEDSSNASLQQVSNNSEERGLKSGGEDWMCYKALKAIILKYLLWNLMKKWNH